MRVRINPILLVLLATLSNGQECHVMDPPAGTHEWLYQETLLKSLPFPSSGTWRKTWTRVRFEDGRYEVMDSTLEGEMSPERQYEDTTITTKQYSLAEGTPFSRSCFQATGFLLDGGDSIHYRSEDFYSGRPCYAFSKKLGLILFDQNTLMVHGRGQLGVLQIVSYDGDASEAARIRDKVKKAISEAATSIRPMGGKPNSSASMERFFRSGRTYNILGAVLPTRKKNRRSN